MYDHGYDSEPIGGGNPYYRCVHCKRSDPEINGNLMNHDPSCEYRQRKLSEQAFHQGQGGPSKMNSLNVKIKLAHPLAVVPTYATDQAGCFDISCIDEGVPHPVDPHARIYRTGLYVEVQPGWALKIYSRSGHGFNCAWSLSNGTGIIDADYRGEIKVSVAGVEGSVPNFKPGDRIAQGAVEPMPRVQFEVVDELSETRRGEGGLGSTGTGAK